MRAADPQKLDALVGRLVGDLGARMHRRSWSCWVTSSVCTGRWSTASPIRRGAGRKDGPQASAMCANGSPARPRPATSITTRRGQVQPDARAGHGLRQGRQPRLLRRRLRDRAVDVGRRAEGRRGLPHRRGRRLARAQQLPVPRHRALLPARLQRQSGRRAGFPRSTASRKSSKRGAKVADVGCGHGASTILMAQAFPKSRFYRLRLSRPFDRTAREQRRQEAGVGDRVDFEVASAKDFPASDYDLVAMFDCLHDMGDPGRRRPRMSARRWPSDGTWMIVEPFAHDGSKDNLNPVGRDLSTPPRR